MNLRTFSLIAGTSYLIIFFCAMYANFFVLEAMIANPLETIAEKGAHVRFGILAFLIAAVFDVIVGWALYEMYKEHVFSRVSTYFRIIHAAIMGIALFALVATLSATSAAEVLAHVADFNNMWLIGLFFFGVHLLFLARIVKHIKIIPYFLLAAGVMYMIDTGAHFLLPNYDSYADIFLTMVAVPSILGEMAFSLWLLFKGGKETVS